MRGSWAIVVALVVGLCGGEPGSAVQARELQAPDFGAAFSRHWHDGKAELAGYELTYPRYGQLRTGTAVTIFVTEPFLKGARVKPEDPAREDFPVIKLNLVQDFQTGIYDYNLMTSAFVTTKPVDGRPAGAATKVSFGAQEWCGHVYAQLRFEADSIALDSHSYFEGEADQRVRLDYPRDGLSEDALWLWARGLAGPALAPGAEARVPILASLEHVRVRHQKLAWQEALLQRAASSTQLSVPAGKFEVEEHRVEITRAPNDTTRWRFQVEKAAPHRIVQVERDDGYRARLRGAARLPYWKLHDEGQEQYLKQLGLEPRPVR